MHHGDCRLVAMRPRAVELAAPKRLRRSAQGRPTRGCRCFLPDAGRIHHHPTNRITAGYDLIPVAIARQPGQAVPLAGSWFGKAQDYLGMSVNVAVHKLGDVADPSAEE